MCYRLAKEQVGSGRSQETLDSVGLQTPSEAGTSVHEEETAEGNYAFTNKVSSPQVSTLRLYHLCGNRHAEKCISEIVEEKNPGDLGQIQPTCQFSFFY